jgi:glyoxylase-like metal-dependent hydrolase (beta-lactamase superfamily II)
MSATIQDPPPLHELAPGLRLARGGPGRSLNVYLLGDVVVDAGVRWSRRRLARQLAGRRLAAHVLSHAHFDHAGCSAWLCHTFDLPPVVRRRRRPGDLQRPRRQPRLAAGQPAAAPPGAGHRPPGEPHPGGGGGGGRVRGAGGARALAGGAGVLAGAGPGASLRRRAGQLRPAPRPAPAGAGAGGAVMG